TMSTEVDEGDYLDIDMTVGTDPGEKIYGALLIKESAYVANAQIISQGSTDNTDLKINDGTLIEGSGGSFSLFGGGLGDLETGDITDFMSAAFSSNEWAAAFSSSTTDNTYTLSVDTDGLAEDDYVVLTGVWDNDDGISTGDRLIAFDQDTVYVDRPTFLPPIAPPPTEEPPTAEEIQELADDEAAEALEILDDADAADIVDELTDDKAASVIQKINITKASKVLERVNTSKASKIIEQSDNEIAAKIMDGIQDDKKNADILGNQTAAKAARVAEKMNATKVAKSINAAPEKMDKFTDMSNEMEEETAASVLLETEVETGANLVRGMAEKDINKAARRVEAAVKRRLESADPETRERVMRKATEILENVDTDNLVNLFVEIANLPETPSTVADVFEEMNTTKVLDVITAWVNVGDLEELGLVFSYLTEDTLDELWTGMSAEERIALYPELDGETIAALPQLGEFTVTDLSVSPETVEPDQSVTISATVTNIGNQTDSTTLVVTVDGAEIATEIVSLEPDESTELAWTHSETTEGTYTVDVMGETVSFTVEAPPAPAEFSLSNLQVSPASVQASEDVMVTFTVENTGELSGDYSIELMLDDESVRTLTGTLDGGESTTVETTVSSETEGTHTVTVDGLEAEFSVEAAPTGFPTTTIIVAVAIVIIAAVGYMYMQKQQ
ncbi:MAG: TIGR04279 domain-containing protein, partial [archaeon]